MLYLADFNKGDKIPVEKVVIKVDICKGCGLCTIVCPKKIMKFSKDKINAKGYSPVEVTDMDACISCASCAKMCPDAVISVYKEVTKK